MTFFSIQKIHPNHLERPTDCTTGQSGTSQARFILSSLQNTVVLRRKFLKKNKGLVLTLTHTRKP